MNVHDVIDADKKRKLGFREITDNQKIVVEGFISGQDFLMLYWQPQGKALYFALRRFAWLAQLCERRPAEREVTGSNPGWTNTQGL